MLKRGLVQLMILLLARGGLADTQETQCSDQLQNSAKQVQLEEGSVSVRNPGSLSQQCQATLFSDTFPSDSCNLSEFPALSSASFPPVKLTRDAISVGLKRLQEAQDIDELGFPTALKTVSVSLDDLKSVAAIVGPRLSEFTNPTCEVTLPRVDNPIAAQLRDYQAISALRRLLRSLPARKAVVWPAQIINPFAAIPREDSKHLFEALIEAHNIHTVFVLISDLQLSLAEVIASTQGLTRGRGAADGGGQTERKTVQSGDNKSGAGGSDENSANNGGDGSGVENSDVEDEELTPEQQQLARDKEEYAPYLKGIEESLVPASIEGFKVLRRLGRLSPPDFILLAA